MTFSAQVCAPHIYLFLSQGIWIDFFCPALFFHKSLKSRAETSSHLPHLAEILLVWMCHTTLKCTQRWPRLLVGHGWKQQTFTLSMCKKSAWNVYKAKSQFGRGKKVVFFSSWHCIYSWFFVPLVPSMWLFFRIYDVCKAVG